MSVLAPHPPLIARRVVDLLGGRYSSELGIDVDAGDGEVERWFVAATLFGTRISASVAGHTFRVLDRAGLKRIAQARQHTWEQLVSLLDQGGYARYDFRTATRLQAIAEFVGDHYGGRIAAIGRQAQTYPELRDALDAVPGWGLVTVGLFLRELRGVWPGAEPPLDPRAVSAATHLGLIATPGTADTLAAVRSVAAIAGCDGRDLESALVRLALAHRRDIDDCPGGEDCVRLRGRDGRHDSR